MVVFSKRSRVVPGQNIMFCFFQVCFLQFPGFLFVFKVFVPFCWLTNYHLLGSMGQTCWFPNRLLEETKRTQVLKHKLGFAKKMPRIYLENKIIPKKPFSFGYALG